ncbi:NF038129 family PEP-CTERM protein [Massilia niastensis]|uniref:NF038129 family PEP-CTERM protein n=1 Tax=Massilia niastensis TaxID=544911 RepID=UPI00037A0A6C|nr:NF038129 family PEP-CTERM protein [Massilia niastensis]
MFNIQALFLRALLALAIASGAPAALAGPIYRVSVDTSAFAGSTGFLDLGLNGRGDVAGFAHVDNFTGDFLAGSLTLGGASGDIVNGVKLRNTEEWNFFDQQVNFGGLFSFDVRIEVPEGEHGLLFSVALFNDAMDAYLGAADNLFTIDVAPGLPAVVEVVARDLVNHTEIPEPSDWLLLATGLLLIGSTRRFQLRR